MKYIICLTDCSFIGWSLACSNWRICFCSLESCLKSSSCWGGLSRSLCLCVCVCGLNFFHAWCMMLALVMAGLLWLLPNGIRLSCMGHVLYPHQSIRDLILLVTYRNFRSILNKRKNLTHLPPQRKRETELVLIVKKFKFKLIKKKFKFNALVTSVYYRLCRENIYILIR